jgi:hypothetical protein
MTVPLDRRFDGSVGVKPDDARSPVRDTLDGHVESRRNVNDAAGAQLPAGMDHRLVSPRLAGWAQQQHFGGRARIAAAEQSSPKDTGGVQDDRVAWRDDPGEIRESTMLEGA